MEKYVYANERMDCYILLGIFMGIPGTLFGIIMLFGDIVIGCAVLIVVGIILSVICVCIALALKMRKWHLAMESKGIRIPGKVVASNFQNLNKQNS